ncbi:hypothetical protein ABIC32_001456 [Brevundimonas sp. 1080]
MKPFSILVLGAARRLTEGFPGEQIELNMQPAHSVG